MSEQNTLDASVGRIYTPDSAVTVNALWERIKRETTDRVAEKGGSFAYLHDEHRLHDIVLTTEDDVIIKGVKGITSRYYSFLPTDGVRADFQCDGMVTPEQNEMAIQVLIKFYGEPTIREGNSLYYKIRSELKDEDVYRISSDEELKQAVSNSESIGKYLRINSEWGMYTYEVRNGDMYGVRLHTLPPYRTLIISLDANILYPQPPTEGKRPSLLERLKGLVA